jgi:hypothetical protein
VAYRTDGEWIWSDEAATYVDRYDMELPPAFVYHIVVRIGSVLEVDDARRLAAVEEIQRWSADAANDRRRHRSL